MGGVAEGVARWNDAFQPMVDEQASFEEFFHSERDRLFRVMFVITKNRQEAEDLSQEAFVRVWERWDTVGAMENPIGYLHRTAMNLFRSRYRRALLAARRGIGIATDEDPYAAIDDRQVALQALASLAPRQRAAIVLTEGSFNTPRRKPGACSASGQRPSAHYISRRVPRSESSGRMTDA